MTSAHNQSASTRRSKYFGPPLAEQEENNNRSKPKYFKPLTTFGTSVAAPVSQRSHKSEGHRLDVSGAGIEIAVTIEDDKEVSVVKSPLRNRQGPVSNHKRHVSQPVSHLICGTLESGGHVRQFLSIVLFFL